MKGGEATPVSFLQLPWQRKDDTGVAGYLTYETFCTSSNASTFNLRVVEYPNGTIQIRVYDTPIRTGDSRLDPDGAPPGYVREPFGGSLIREVREFDRTLSQVMDSRRNSLARTRRCITDYARCAEWEWFATFTFAPERSDRSDYGRCCRQMRTWLKNSRDRKAPELQYLAVPELHRDGLNWHFHALLARTGALEFVDSGLVTNGMKIYNVPSWTTGFSTATQVQDTFRVSTYISKYMNKAVHLLTQGEHRYFISQGLPKPRISSFLIDQGEVDTWLQAEMKKRQIQPVWERTIRNDFLDMRVIECRREKTPPYV